MILTLTFQGYSGLNVMMSLDSPYMHVFPFMYIVTACLSITILVVIATQKVFSYLISLGPNYEKAKVHQMTSK